MNVQRHNAKKTKYSGQLEQHIANCASLVAVVVEATVSLEWCCQLCQLALLPPLTGWLHYSFADGAAISDHFFSFSFFFIWLATTSENVLVAVISG